MRSAYETSAATSLHARQQSPWLAAPRRTRRVMPRSSSPVGEREIASRLEDAQRRLRQEALAGGRSCIAASTHRTQAKEDSANSMEVALIWRNRASGILLAQTSSQSFMMLMSVMLPGGRRRATA